MLKKSEKGMFLFISAYCIGGIDFYFISFSKDIVRVPEFIY